MLIFNGKKYFVPFISTGKVAGADATPDQVVEGVKFAGANGVVEEGELEKYDYTNINDIMVAYCGDVDETDIFITTYFEKPKYVPVGAVFSKVPLEQFGDATAADVRKGKRFTSIYGWDEEGTMEESGASIDTCTFNVTFSKNAGQTLISATTFENGTISVVNQRVSDKNSGQSFSIPNVVCGSALSINTEYRVNFYGSLDKYYHGFSQGGTITVPTAPGTYTVEVGEIDDD